MYTHHIDSTDVKKTICILIHLCLSQHTKELETAVVHLGAAMGLLTRLPRPRESSSAAFTKGTPAVYAMSR